MTNSSSTPGITPDLTPVVSGSEKNIDREIIALIPAFNESGRIEPVIQKAERHLKVIVVDDGSTDNTSKVAESAGANKIIKQTNKGKGAALRTGFQWAINAGYIAVITLDADGQHDPADIPGFLDIFAMSDADLIIGYRDFSEIPFPRRIANSFGRITFSWAVGQDIPDNQSGYRLISKRLMKNLMDSKESGFEFEVEMIKICIKAGFALKWTPIRTIYGGESSHISPLHHIKNYLRIVWETYQDMRE